MSCALYSLNTDTYIEDDTTSVSGLADESAFAEDEISGSAGSSEEEAAVRDSGRDWDASDIELE